MKNKIKKGNASPTTKSIYNACVSSFLFGKVKGRGYKGIVNNLPNLPNLLITNQLMTNEIDIKLFIYLLMWFRK